MPRRPVSRSRSRAAATAALVVLGSIGALLSHWYRVAHARDAASMDRVAVFPFAVRSRNGQPAYLHEGAATLLGLALDGAGRLRIVDPNAVLSASPAALDVEAGRRTAQALGAGQFVLGEINDAGARLSVSATLYDVDGHSQVRATAVGDESRVFELVDSLARRLAVSAMTDSTVRLANVAAISTRSLAAFKSFLAGETQLRAGHYREAVAQFQNAVAADSSFGLAYYRLSLAREWTDGEISSDSAAALAEHFASTLPDRDRKLLAARRAFVRRDLAAGERLANQVLSSYPTDADAWAQLGELRIHLGPNVGRSIVEARDPFLNVLRYRKNDLAARVHLTRIAAYQSDSAHVDEWSGSDSGFGDASEIGTFELAAMRDVVLGDERARAALNAALRRATDITVESAIWRIATYTRDYEGASRIELARRREGFVSRSEALPTDIARGHLAPPRVGDAGVISQHAIVVALMFASPSAPDLPLPALRAHENVARVANSGDGQASIAAVAAARLLEARYPDLPAIRLNSPLPANVDRTLQRVVGAMRIEGKSPLRALGMVSVDSLDDGSVFSLKLYDILASIRAEALHKLGRDAEALAWLETTGLGSAGASANVPFAVRRQGEIEEQSGNHLAAGRHARAFATMWQNADAELRPLVRDALAKSQNLSGH